MDDMAWEITDDDDELETKHAEMLDAIDQLNQQVETDGTGRSEVQEVAA